MTIFGCQGKTDKWTIRATELINWLYDNKQELLQAGDNITLTPQPDGTVRIDAAGGGGDISDVQMNGSSIVEDGIATFNNYVEITQAEYDALPASKISDGILYCIKDGAIDPVMVKPDQMQSQLPALSSASLASQLNGTA